MIIEVAIDDFENAPNNLQGAPFYRINSSTGYITIYHQQIPLALWPSDSTSSGKIGIIIVYFNTIKSLKSMYNNNVFTIQFLLKDTVDSLLFIEYHYIATLFIVWFQLYIDK